ncbi:TPA: hypothetical protein OW416_005601 [Pseudomonas aeruginosa]|nr:hypothetical protein [Pseudomonas aeruginosa]
MSKELNKALELLREIRPSIPKDVLELWCKDRDAFLAQRSEFHQHLKECADEVATWPTYKREALGPFLGHELGIEGETETAKELNKAPVEQAGGDERAAFEAAFSAMGRPVCRADYDQDAYGTPFDDGGWTGWQARAALAQPSTASDLDPLNLAPHAEAFNEAPDEALRPEQAEAERPEVVARVVHSNPVVLDHCGPLNANDELMTVAQHAASVARWAEMFNRVEQERDAALSRVAELEKQEPSGWLAYYFGGKRNGKIYGGPCGTKEEIDRYIQHVERSDDSISLQGKPFYAAPVAQAQHSVPDGVTIERDVAGTIHIKVGDFDFIQLQYQRPYTDNASTWKLAERIASLLAAAPGKEGV